MTAKDLISSQTGSGAIAIKRSIWNFLSEIHYGSLSVDARLSYSVGASDQVKRGNIVKEKIFGKKVKGPPKNGIGGRIHR